MLNGSGQHVGTALYKLSYLGNKELDPEFHTESHFDAFLSWASLGAVRPIPGSTLVKPSLALAVARRTPLKQLIKQAFLALSLGGSVGGKRGC